VVSVGVGRNSPHRRAAAVRVLTLQLRPATTEWTEEAADAADNDSDGAAAAAAAAAGDDDGGGDLAGQLRLDVVAPLDWLPGALAAVRASLQQQYGMGAAAPLRRFTFRLHNWLGGADELTAEEQDVRSHACKRLRDALAPIDQEVERSGGAVAVRRNSRRRSVPAPPWRVPVCNGQVLVAERVGYDCGPTHLDRGVASATRVRVRQCRCDRCRCLACLLAPVTLTA
jgi:hypothetical protein